MRHAKQKGPSNWSQRPGGLYVCEFPVSVDIRGLRVDDCCSNCWTVSWPFFRARLAPYLSDLYNLASGFSRMPAATYSVSQNQVLSALWVRLYMVSCPVLTDPPPPMVWGGVGTRIRYTHCISTLCRLSTLPQYYKPPPHHGGGGESYTKTLKR